MIKLRTIKFVCLFMVLSCYSFGQDGWNTCLFRIYDAQGKLLTANDTLNFTIYNDHPYHKKIVNKVLRPLSTYPDNCWILHTEPEIDHYKFPSSEDIVLHPNLIIVNKIGNDTMKIHYNFLVYAFKEGTNIPIINEILFTSGEFDVYVKVTKKDWSNCTAYRKIKKRQKGSVK